MPPLPAIAARRHGFAGTRRVDGKGRAGILGPEDGAQHDRAVDRRLRLHGQRDINAAGQAEAAALLGQFRIGHRRRRERRPLRDQHHHDCPHHDMSP
ncbi:hypothetical protein NPJ82_06890 [Sphingomonas sp. NY01]|uniref:hypothetical protein n=1 Tax=Sphingomonas sp. NY01 TaxID=2968057 RepID=UPI00315D6BF4